MAIFKSSNSGIPFGNTAGRPASPSSGQPYFNGELQRLELYTGAQYGWQNIVAETPGVTGYTGTISETSGGTILITGTNFSSGAVATIIGQDGTEYIATTTTVNNLTSITATFPAASASIEPYDIRVTNPSNLYGVYYDILTINDKPIWSTAAGSLGNFYNGSVSYQLSATDEENNSLTYSLVSGSLIPGLTLSSSGLISGTANGVYGTTYSFTVSVSDGINTTQLRAFSMYTSYPGLTGGTLTSDATYYYRTFTANSNLVINGGSVSADILMIGGGGGGGFQVGGGGGGGGYVQLSNYTLPAYSNVITIGSGGAGGGGSSRAYNGGDTSIQTNVTTITAIGGGGGANHGTSYNQNNSRGWDGGSGGGGSGDSSSVYELGGSSIQSTTIGGQSGVGFGNSGGQGRAGNWAGGGGGGAGAAGQNSPSVDVGGTGGAGKQWTNGSYYAGGGGGCNNSSSSNVSGGIGGGGSGTGNSNNSSAKNGSDNTGGGGGGVRDTSGNGGNGGSGLIIIRYTKASVGG